MIGWGGGCCGDAWSGGSAYDPAAKSWRTLARSPLAPSQGPIGAWTGHELVLLVSGIDPGSGKPWPARFARAAAYDPATDAWRRIAQPPTADARFGGTAVWDGREVPSWAPAPARRTRSPTTRPRTTGGASLPWSPATVEPPRSGQGSGCWSGVGRVTTPRATCSHGTGSATTRRPTAGRPLPRWPFGREMDSHRGLDRAPAGRLGRRYPNPSGQEHRTQIPDRRSRLHAGSRKELTMRRLVGDPVVVLDAKAQTKNDFDCLPAGPAKSHEPRRKS